MTGLQPEFWVDRPTAAVGFYTEAFGATVLHQVGDGEDIVAQLAVDDAAFWVSAADPDAKRFNPAALGGGTGRTLLVVDDPDGVFARALAAGAVSAAPVADEHGWRLGRIIDPFGHEWGDRPPARPVAAGLAGAGGFTSSVSHHLWQSLPRLACVFRVAVVGA